MAGGPFFRLPQTVAAADHRPDTGRSWDGTSLLETLFALQPDQLAQARVWIDEIAGQWDDALDRLKTHVEDEAD
jgi:hypothetical protein